MNGVGAPQLQAEWLWEGVQDKRKLRPDGMKEAWGRHGGHRRARPGSRRPDTDNGRRTYDKQDETPHVLRFLWVNT